MEKKGMRVVEIQYDSKRELYLLTIKRFEKGSAYGEPIEVLEDVVSIAPVTHPELLAQGFGRLLTSGFSYSAIKKTKLPENAPHNFSWRYELEPNATVICELPILHELCEYDSVYLLAIPR